MSQDQASLFAGTGRLFDGDGEIGDLTVDFVARQDVQPGQENGAFENGIGGPVEPLEGRMLRLMHDLAVEPGTRRHRPQHARREVRHAQALAQDAARDCSPRAREASPAGR